MMPEQGTGETVELTLFLIAASDSSRPHGWAACTTLYGMNEAHARQRAKPWIDMYRATLPHIEVEALPHGFTIHKSALPGKIRVPLPESVDGEARL